MPLYLIEKKIIASLIVNCADRDQASAWIERIVATLEDEHGNPISPEVVEDFDDFSD